MGAQLSRDPAFCEPLTTTFVVIDTVIRA